MKNTFNYLDLKSIEGGWSELFAQMPEWITELRKPKYNPLTKKDELALVVLNTPKARDRVISANLRFVTNIARRYIVEEVDVWELISAGNEGLINAYEKFDPNRDVKLITYAVNHIRNSMIEAMRDAKVVKLSKRAVQLLSDYSFYGDVENMKRELPHRYHQTNEELIIKIESYLNMKWSISLDEKFDDGSSRAETIKSVESRSETFQQEIRDLLDASDLDPTENLILVKMFGLNGNDPMGSREIGTELGKSKDTIRRIKLKAFEKLKNIERLKDILDFINDDDSAVVYAQPTIYSSD